ncbi:MAG: carboxylesterase family protein, partial [Stackebrandtia sp.]
ISLQFDAIGHPVTPEQYEAIIRDGYGANADRVLAMYPLSAFPSPSIALSTVNTDFGTALSTCAHLDSYRTFTTVPVHAYQFADRTAPPLLEVPNFDEGAQHAVELNFLFPRLFGAPLRADQEALATTMVAYWTNFAHRGTPGGHKLPDWPRFGSESDVLSLDIGPGNVRPTDIAAASNCAFWAALPPQK